ncbi:hypothetical protein OG21DRAFT_1173840 [Imleria badia]|nr:hypothetical protein OG21DRAFT_1173840 [Imleria badia]
MPGWTLVDTHPTQGRTFQRPLDVLEVWLLWDGLFNGALDCLQYCELRLLNGSQDAHLFSDANIVKAWLSAKWRFPLAGATVRGADRGPLRFKTATDSNAENGTGFESDPHFVVREHDFTVLRPREIVFGSVVSAEEAQQRMTVILNDRRPLSEELLMQLYVFRETKPQRMDILHFITLSAHCVTDRAAMNTFARCFIDTLARGGGSEPTQISLEDRLAMVTPLMDREQKYLRSLSPAIRRWRRAVGMVIFQLRMAKTQGGHTLPCRLTRSTPHVAAKSDRVYTSLTRTQTAAVIANCRLHDITFGNAFIALAQVAMTRVLYRRYLRGDISEEEWAYRKTQPCIGGGPFSLRPYLDTAWFQSGGGGEHMMSIGIFPFQLPFMTLGETTKQHQRVLSSGAPPFPDLLTFNRFLHRTGLVKRQVTAFFNHPLFFDIVRATCQADIEQTRLDTLRWMKHVETTNSDAHGNSDYEPLAVSDIPMVWAFMASSAGNMDLALPTEFPIPPTHPLSPYSSVPHPVKAGYSAPPSPPVSTSEAEMTPKVMVENSGIHMHARPAEHYLTADSISGRLNMYVIYDRNVFEEVVVREWLDEVREAVLWYLGQTHRSNRAQQPERRGGGHGHVGRGKSLQAKL